MDQGAENFEKMPSSRYRYEDFMSQSVCNQVAPNGVFADGQDQWHEGRSALHRGTWICMGGFASRHWGTHFQATLGHAEKC